MRNNRKIIAVVGPSGGIDGSKMEEIKKHTKEIGKLIIQYEHILLTGGKPDRDKPDSVKSAAMIGAQDAGGKSKPARLISVLSKPTFEVKLKLSEECKQLVIKTNLGDKRNFINGYVPDVMIVISGGPGTLSEVAFANYYDIPIVLLETSNIKPEQDLTIAYSKPEPRNKFDRIIKDSQDEFPYFDPVILNQKLTLFLNSPDNFKATTSKETVDKAIQVATNRSNRLPENLPIIKKYEEELMNLASPELRSF